MTTTTPRLVPLPLDRWGSDHHAMLRGQLAAADRYLINDGTAPPLPNVLGLFAHHPGLTAPWLALSTALNAAGVLSARDRELLVLRVSWRTGCAYEWGQHVRMGRAAGLSDAEIGGIGHDIHEYAWPPRDAALLEATDELLRSHGVADRTWSCLTEHFDDQEVLEVLFVVGTYLSLALVMNSVGLQPDAGSDEAVPSCTTAYSSNSSSTDAGKD